MEERFNTLNWYQPTKRERKSDRAAPIRGFNAEKELVIPEGCSGTAEIILE